MRLFLSDQSVVITKDFFLYFEEADLLVRGVSSSCVNSLFEMRPRRACELAVCSGLEGPRSSSVNSLLAQRPSALVLMMINSCSYVY